MTTIDLLSRFPAQRYSWLFGHTALLFSAPQNWRVIAFAPYEYGGWSLQLFGGAITVVRIHDGKV